MCAAIDDRETLDGLLDDLDVRAQRDHIGERSESYWVCKRRHPRYPFRAPCIVRFLPMGSPTVSELPGRTRNLSRSGLGFLVRRVFAVGEPVELEVHAAGRPRTYMAGLVTFCRYAGQGFHEVGVTLKAAQDAPIFSISPLTAAQSLDWLQTYTQPA